MVANTRRNSSFVVGDGKDIDLNGRFILGPEHPHLVKKVASANVRHSADDEIYRGAASYARVRWIAITNGMKGSARISFELKTNQPPDIVYGRIYRNGAPLGAIQSDVTGTYTLKTEDITQDWAPGDMCELYLNGGGVGAYAINFRISYDDAPTVVVASTQGYN